jgi:hypothetical protein
MERRAVLGVTARRLRDLPAHRILRVRFRHPAHRWTHASAHHRRIHRKEQVPSLPCRQEVAEQDANRPVLRRGDEGPEVARGVDRVYRLATNEDGRGGPVEVRAGQRDVLADTCIDGRLELDIATQQRRRQARVELHAVLHERDLEVVGTLVRLRVRHRDRDVLTEVVRAALPQERKRVDELLDLGAIGVVRIGAEEMWHRRGARRL